MPRTMNIVAITVRANHRTITDEVLRFPVGENAPDPVEIGEKVVAILRKANEELAAELGYDLGEDDGEDEE